MSEDPIGFDGGINFYAYVNNNPLTNNDPMGLFGGFFMPPVGGGLTIDQQIAITNAQTEGVVLAGLTASGIFAAPYVFEFASPYVVAGYNEAALFTGANTNWLLPAAAFGSGVATKTPGPLGVPLPSSNIGTAIDLGQTFSGAYNSLEFGVNNFINDASLFINDTINQINQPWAQGRYPDPNFQSSTSGGANGGFVLYPNKINNNISSGVYQK